MFKELYQKLIYKLNALGYEGLYFDLKLNSHKYIRIRFW